MNTPDIIIYTDGGARGNPGPAGAGIAIFNGKEELLKELSTYLGEKTNNWAEYEAVVQGLTALKKMYGKKLKDMHVEVRLDSQLVARQLSGEYQIKEESLFSQYIAAHNLRVSAIPNITYVHVPREKNKDADRLANKAMDRGS